MGKWVFLCHVIGNRLHKQWTQWLQYRLWLHKQWLQYKLLLHLYPLSAGDDRISLIYFIACQENSGKDSLTCDSQEKKTAT